MRERDAWRAGLLSLALALAVRLGPAAVRGLERRSFPEQADAFLLYLQTGLRQASTAPLPLYYAPESSGPETVQEAAPVLLSRRETPEKPVFTAEDGAAVLLDNDAGVSPDVEDLIQLAPDFPAADGPKVLIYSTHTTESYTKSGIEITILLLALGFCQPVRKLNEHHLHLGTFIFATVDFTDDLYDPVAAFLPQFIPEIRLLLIDLQQVLTEDLLRQISLDGFDSLLRKIFFVRVDRVGHHVDMRMAAGIVKRGVPAEVLRGDLHLLGNSVPLGAEQVHPRIRVVIAQPLRILPAEGDDVRPDIAGMLIHLLLYLRQHDGYTLVGEQTVAAGTLIDIFEIHIPLWRIAVQFQNAADERIRIAASSVVSIVLVLVTVLAVRVLFQQPCDLLLLFCGGRQMTGGTSDCCGNAKGTGGKNNCGSMGFANHDARFADHTVIITDTLVPFPNLPSSISCIDVDAVCVVDEVGDPKKIATKEARMTQDPRELMMAKNTARVIAATPWFKDGSSFQTGVGGPSLAVNRFLEEHMREKSIKMSFALGGTSSAICALQGKGLVDYILDTQDFDQGAAAHLGTNPRHVEIDLSEYANAGNKGAYVNKLDYVVLSALEIDTKFNVNVITGSDGIFRGAPGGHPDTAAGSKCCIIVTPLIRGRMATVCKDVVTVTTPGDCVDVLVTDYGIAVNPLRPDIRKCLDNAGIPTVSIQSLQEKAYDLVGTPDPLQWEDQVVAVVEARDGTILDVVRKIKPYRFD